MIGAAALHNVNWFYPAFLMIVGAHYLPFIFLYGMWQYGVPAAVMLAAGLGLGRLAPASFPTPGGLGGIVLLLFAGWVSLARRRHLDA